MLVTRTLAVLCSFLALNASAQPATQTPDPANTAIARVFHPTPPLHSYDVATVKPFSQDGATIAGPNGMTRRILVGSTLRQYIRNAYSPGMAQLSAAQVIGGPDWIDKEKYDIQGKPSPDLELAIKKMTNDERNAQSRALQQSLLADRFHLKVHFEVREMPVYALVRAKGGLKIKPVDAPAPRDPNSPPVAFTGPNQPLPPGMSVMMMKSNGERTMRATATQMSNLVGMISGQPDTGGRPVIDQTGFTGYFNIDNFTFASPTNAAPSDDPKSASDAPSLATALEESLGIKLVATKGPVEVVVIDSIDHPSEN